MNRIGVRMGMSFRFVPLRMDLTVSVVAFSLLTGTPIAGALISRDNGGYAFAIVFSAVSMIVGFALITAGRIAKVGPQIMVKT